MSELGYPQRRHNSDFLCGEQWLAVGELSFYHTCLVANALTLGPCLEQRISRGTLVIIHTLILQIFEILGTEPTTVSRQASWILWSA